MWNTFFSPYVIYKISVYYTIALVFFTYVLGERNVHSTNCTYWHFYMTLKLVSQQTENYVLTTRKNKQLPFCGDIFSPKTSRFCGTLVYMLNVGVLKKTLVVCGIRYLSTINGQFFSSHFGGLLMEDLYLFILSTVPRNNPATGARCPAIVAKAGQAVPRKGRLQKTQQVEVAIWKKGYEGISLPIFPDETDLPCSWTR